MNIIDLKNKLDRGEFDSVIGLVEDEHLEAKSGKYEISNESHKLEFAKDVSSFANHDGGLIVIGAQTSADPAYSG